MREKLKKEMKVESRKKKAEKEMTQKVEKELKDKN